MSHWGTCTKESAANKKPKKLRNISRLRICYTIAAFGAEGANSADIRQNQVKFIALGKITDLRWRQRLENLQRALGQLKAALEAHNACINDEVIGMAVVKAYEFSFELSWKTLKDLLSYEGIDAQLPREVLRQAFSYGLLKNGQLWIDMLEQRNLMAHTYDQARANQALMLIRETFAPELLQLAAELEKRP
ncbi:nucleotidyltransferase substrate binding protein [uncultured Synechococcus sp.]|uniref:nucleotidyltransferase substrate binding protein n=1 Tax=uncultured Synechococcus sp. TaxID=154535 RepID=UPI002599F744|nr:nucleotidyltransferase substrate binding protein [uncultured Synechococcus sp.]